MMTYKVHRESDGKFEPAVDPIPVRLPKPWNRFKFFTNRAPHIFGGIVKRQFNLTEAKSGAAIAICCPSRKIAIKRATARLRTITVNRFLTVRRQYIAAAKGEL